MKKVRILLDLDCEGLGLVPKRVKAFLHKVPDLSPTMCWEYPGVKVDGYVQVRARPGGGFIQAHRLSWMIHNGAIPPNNLVLHTCDNRCCVNPSHLFVGTHKDNAEDRESKGRGNQPKGSKNGWAKLTERQVLAIRKRHIPGKGGNARSLMNEYDISQPTFHRIIRRVGWRHV